MPYSPRVLADFASCSASEGSPSLLPPVVVVLVPVHATVPDRGKKSVGRWLEMYYGEAVSVTTPMLHRVNPRLRQMYIRLPWRARLVDESLAEDASRQDTDVGRAEQDAVRMRVLVQALEQRLPAINDVRSPAVAEAGVIVELASGGGRAAGRKLHVPGRTLVFVSSVDSADRVVQGLLAVGT